MLLVVGVLFISERSNADRQALGIGEEERDRPPRQLPEIPLPCARDQAGGSAFL